MKEKSGHIKLMRYFCLLVIFALGFMTIVSCSGGGGGGGGGDTGNGTVIDHEGGVITITDPSNHLYGLEVDIPQGTLTTSETINVEAANTTIPLPTGITTSGIIISLSPEGLNFNDFITITIPYDSPDVPTIVSYNQPTNAYEVLAIVAVDDINKTVTVRTNHFSLIGKVATYISEKLQTDFKISEDAFSMNNTSSDFGQGVCWGFSSYSKWYFQNKPATGGYLRNRYGDCEKSLLLDAQETAYNALPQLFISLLFQVLPEQLEDLITLGEINTALFLSGLPQVLGLCPDWVDLFDGGVCHAVLVYAISATSSGYTYHIYENQDNSGEYEITFNNNTTTFDDYHEYSQFFFLGKAWEPNMQNIYDQYNNCNGSDTSPPTAPTNLTATASASSQIDLSWTASTDNVDVTGYNVYRDGSHIDSTTLTSYSDTGLSASTQYCYTVSAYDAAGNESDPSNEDCATTGSESDTQDPTTPTGLIATAISSSQIDLSWTASTDNVDVTGYNVYRDGSHIDSTTLTSYSDTGLSASTQYCYTVSAYDAAGNESDPSNEDCATTDPPVVTTSKGPDTGQTKCYDNSDEIICPQPGESFYGQDANYNINPPSYTDNGDGTVMDNVTSLIWQKEDDDTLRNWDDAISYCDDLTLAGYSDWRLPSKKELISIVDYGTYRPSIDTTYFPDAEERYWSSTTYVHDSSEAWEVALNYGGAFHYGKSYNYYARCVRGQELSFGNFTDNGDGSVTDNNTGLIWQQGEDGQKTWEDAIAYCEDLSLAGHTDWRLPNIKELESITDDTLYNPAIDTNFFPDAIASHYYSSTTFASSSSYALDVVFDRGYLDADNKADDDRVRCVRVGQ